MTKQSFSLIPCCDSDIPALQCSGRVVRQNNFLSVQYSLLGEAGNIVLPAPSTPPKRKDGLWATTCFEFFLALPDDPQYWEFNLSPSGDWNVYHMDAYRRVGFREETSIQRLQFEVTNEADCVLLNADVDLSPLISADHPIQLGFASVIQTIERHQSYWALAHLDSKADFHIRDSFLIHL